MSLVDENIGKGRKITGFVLSILPSLLMGMSAIMKLMGAAPMVESMSLIPNFEDQLTTIGLLSITSLTLYWIPKTSNLGFFLVASYFGGVIVAEIVSGQPPMTGILCATLFYVGTFLRKPSLLGGLVK